MQITVFGASGKVGRQVVALALEHGHEVNAFVHSHNPFQGSEGVTVYKGNVRDVKAIAAAIVGSDAVISALGSWGTKNKDIVSSGMKTIIPAMEKQGVERIITITGSGAFWSKDKPSFLGRAAHGLLKIGASGILEDGEQHIRLLEASDLKWTCVRSPAMTKGKNITYRLGFKSPAPWATIPRKAVAECLLDLAENSEYRRQAPFISR